MTRQVQGETRKSVHGSESRLVGPVGKIDGQICLLLLLGRQKQIQVLSCCNTSYSDRSRDLLMLLPSAATLEHHHSLLNSYGFLVLLLPVGLWLYVIILSLSRFHPCLSLLMRTAGAPYPPCIAPTELWDSLLEWQRCSEACWTCLSSRWYSRSWKWTCCLMDIEYRNPGSLEYGDGQLTCLREWLSPRRKGRSRG